MMPLYRDKIMFVLFQLPSSVALDQWAAMLLIKCNPSSIESKDCDQNTLLKQLAIFFPFKEALTFFTDRFRVFTRAPNI